MSGSGITPRQCNIRIPANTERDDCAAYARAQAAVWSRAQGVTDSAHIAAAITAIADGIAAGLHRG